MKQYYQFFIVTIICFGFAIYHCYINDLILLEDSFGTGEIYRKITPFFGRMTMTFMLPIFIGCILGLRRFTFSSILIILLTLYLFTETYWMRAISFRSAAFLATVWAIYIAIVLLYSILMWENLKNDEFKGNNTILDDWELDDSSAR